MTAAVDDVGSRIQRDVRGCASGVDRCSGGIAKRDGCGRADADIGVARNDRGLFDQHAFSGFSQAVIELHVVVAERHGVDRAGWIGTRDVDRIAAAQVDVDVGVGIVQC